MLALALGLWLLGLRVLVTAGLLWVFRWATLASSGCWLSMRAADGAIAPRAALMADNLHPCCCVCAAAALAQAPGVARPAAAAACQLCQPHADTRGHNAVTSQQQAARGVS